MAKNVEKSPVGKDKPRIKLIGLDGNAFILLGHMRAGLKKAGFTPDEIDQFHLQATSGDYNHLLCVCGEWADIG